MNNTIVTVPFLLLLAYFSITLTQEPLQSYQVDRNRLLEEQPGRTYHNFTQSVTWMNTPAHQLLAKDNVKKLNAIIPDFQVNDNGGPRGPDQVYPDVSSHISGNFVITWKDDRSGNDDIYAQRYANDGSTLGTNFRVNDD